MSVQHNRKAKRRRKWKRMKKQKEKGMRKTGSGTKKKIISEGDEGD